MLLFLTIVIGFTIFIFTVIGANMFFIAKNMDIHSAERVDPKPMVKY